jgi:hypothetical protein
MDMTAGDVIAVAVGVVVGGGCVWVACLPEDRLREFAAPRLGALLLSRIPAVLIRGALATLGAVIVALTVTAALR